ISTDDQQVAAIKPGIELPKASTADLHFNGAVDAEHRHRDVADIAAASGAGGRHALGSEAVALQKANQRTLGAVALVTTSAAAHDRPLANLVSCSLLLTECSEAAIFGRKASSNSSRSRPMSIKSWVVLLIRLFIRSARRRKLETTSSGVTVK